MSEKLTVTLPSDLEIVMTRVFDAPRALVFEAHSRCEHLTQWFAGGSPGSTMDCELDFRPGGRYRYVETTDDGSVHAFRGEIREVVAPERIVQTFEYEGMPGHISVETLEFTEEGGKTRLTTTAVFTSREDRDGMVSSGMEEGAGRAYDKLEALLRTLV